MKLVISLLLLCFFVAGCKFFDSNSTPEPYEAHYTNTPIKVDGKLNEAIWKKAMPLDFRPLPNNSYTEKGIVKILWDDKYVYVGGVFQDSDIVQEATENWQHHYVTGDVMEVFLRPVGKRYYWEIYSTPNNLKTSFFYLSKGRLGLPSSFNYKAPGIHVASICDGTFNNGNDRDKLWTTELAIPRKELEKLGEEITPGKVWRFLIGRYNYGAHLDAWELTTNVYPKPGGFHNLASWSYLKFVKQ